jgi:hypothetical protein
VNQTELSKKAQSLLERRQDGFGVGYYLRVSWRRQLLFLALYAGMVYCLYLMGSYVLATVFLGFALGRTIRDLQWFHRLAQEWPSTVELLDWDRITQLAEQRDA